MKITFLGGAQEIGRNSLLVDAGKNSFLLDYGIDVQEMKYPQLPKAIPTAVFVSHAHLDHVGAVPMLFAMGYKGNVFATNATHDLSLLLLYDSIRVQQKRGQEPLFSEAHVEATHSSRRNVIFDEKINFDENSVQFFNAGHVPGSMATLIRDKEKSILYTGDIKFIDTRLMKSAYTDYDDITALVCESTYLYKSHPSRKKLENELKDIVSETIADGGTVLFPAFAIGRTQELILILSEMDVPLYMDGMGIDATEIMLSHPDSMKDFKKLKDAFGRAVRINRPRQRREAMIKPSIIVTTSGMLNGGPIHNYIKKLHNNQNCRIILTGYQSEGTVGRRLLDTGYYTHDGMDKKVEMDIKFMDFSAHCGRKSLLSFFKKTNPEKIILIHSDRTPEYAQELNSMGFQSFAPKNGETITI